MRKLFISVMCIAILSISGIGYADSTIGGWPACTTKKDMENLVAYQVDGNTDAVTQLGSSGRCFILKNNYQVTITDSIWTGLVEINGSAWTVTEAIKRN